MTNLRIFLSSLVLPAILVIVMGLKLKSVEGQDSPGLSGLDRSSLLHGPDEIAIVEGSWRDAATTLEFPETDGRNNIQRYLVQNCVVEVSSSMSIVSQVSMDDEEEDEEARRLTNGHRNTGSTCTVEVVTTSTTSISTVSAPPLSPVDDSLSKQDRASTTDQYEPKTKGPKTKGPKTKGPKTKGPKTKGPKTKAMEMKMTGMKEKGPKSKGPTTSPTMSPTTSPTCTPDPVLCIGCIDNFGDLKGNVTAGGQLYICGNTKIVVNESLTWEKDTTISCCNNCTAGLASTCVLESGIDFGDYMFVGLVAVKLGLQRLTLDGKSSSGVVAMYRGGDFVLTSSVVKNFNNPNGGNIEVYGPGTTTVTDSVVQDNVSHNGVVYLAGSNGNVQRTVFSNNDPSGDGESGSAVRIIGMATVNFVGSTFKLNSATTRGGAVAIYEPATVNFVGCRFQMNSATDPDRSDIGVTGTTVTVKCDNATICNSNTGNVFIEGDNPFMNQCNSTCALP